MLITAGNLEKYNMMTASWGGMGILWLKPVCFIFVRPSRYNYEFLEKNDHFSLNFFTEDYRSVLNFCGSKSGRDVDKMQEAALTPQKELETVFFKEARLVFLCEKLYYHDILEENFLQPISSDIYGQGNYHRMYIAEVATCYLKSE